jgi:hypothetical protein
VALLAAVLNDVPALSVGSAFFDLHVLPANNAVQQIDQGALVVIQMMSSLVGLRKNPSRARDLGERFVGSDLSGAFAAEPHADIAIAVLHFLTLPAFVPAVPSVTFGYGNPSGCKYQNARLLSGRFDSSVSLFRW